MDRSQFVAIARSVPPPVRKMVVASMADAEIELHHPQAIAIIPALAAHPVLTEFFFNETADGGQALTEFNLNTLLDLFSRMGTNAVALVIASAMRNPETGACYAGDAEIVSIIEGWSPADHVQALLLIHEVTNFVSFFALLWSLARQLPVGQRMESAFKTALETSDSEQAKSSVSGTSLNFEPDLFIKKTDAAKSEASASSSVSTPEVQSSDSESRSPVSAEAA